VPRCRVAFRANRPVPRRDMTRTLAARREVRDRNSAADRAPGAVSRQARPPDRPTLRVVRAVCFLRRWGRTRDIPTAVHCRARRRWALALVPGLFVAGPSPLRAAPDDGNEATVVGPAQSAQSPQALPERFTGCRPGKLWLCCSPTTAVGVAGASEAHEPTCIRSRAARLLLLSLGALAGGVSAAMLFAIGDRHAGGDPATFLVGAGALAGVGALTGMAARWIGGDRRGDPDRVRPETLGLEYAFGGPQILDETRPHRLSFTFAPTYWFPHDDGRIRLFGSLGGMLVEARDVDPRPQNSMPIEGQESTAPVVLSRQQLRINLGIDMAVDLPYPVLSPRRSAYLGPAELRWRPTVHVRRDVFDDGSDDERTLERTMLLPLTVGTRWHLSPRQRFTVYFGPRFDFVSFSEPGSDGLKRGGASIGPFHGEAWYDIDVPFTVEGRRDGRPRRASVNGMLSLGYVHSRFDGRGFNFGPVRGFLGPIHLSWHTRVRPTGWPVALQGSVGAWLGNGVGLFTRVGVVLPDLRRRAR
jgi:hypothetical protein